MNTIDGITIDREFRNLIPLISPEERKQLEENIAEHGGARDPLVVWSKGDRDILVDGHNRYEICTRLGLEYGVERMEFGSRDEAADWIDRNQLGRRNLSKQDYKLLLGRRYNRAKKANDGSRGNQHTEAADKMSTAESIAAEHGVNERTVRRAGKFAEAAAKLGIEKEIVAGKVKATQAQVVKAANALPEKPTIKEVDEAAETLKEKPKRRASRPAAEIFKPYPPTRSLEAVKFYSHEFLERCPSRVGELRAALVELIASCDATE